MAHQLNSESEPFSKSSSKTSAAIEFNFLTLFPELFSGALSSSLLGKAEKKGLVSFKLTQVRDFATSKHHTVDDTPYGGGEGMLMKVDVLHSAWKSISESSPTDKVITLLLSPQGAVFNQEMARELSHYSKIIFVCGHYEGVDERFIQLCVDREVSIGDYILTGGELPALVMADTIARLIPGVVGNDQSVSRDSLENGLVKYPQYTRPRDFQGSSVPDVLLSGDHQAIQRWRDQEMLDRTRQKRPDLWEKYVAENPPPPPGKKTGKKA
jgi:tRNA (guanine37-N1)-methyltransferase